MINHPCGQTQESAEEREGEKEGRGEAVAIAYKQLRAALGQDAGSLRSNASSILDVWDAIKKQLLIHQLLLSHHAVITITP